MSNSRTNKQHGVQNRDTFRDTNDHPELSVECRCGLRDRDPRLREPGSHHDESCPRFTWAQEVRVMPSNDCGHPLIGFDQWRGSDNRLYCTPECAASHGQPVRGTEG